MSEKNETLPPHTPDFGAPGHPKRWCERCRIEAESAPSAVEGPARDEIEATVRLIIKSFRDAPRPSVQIAVDEIMMTFEPFLRPAPVERPEVMTLLEEHENAWLAWQSLNVGKVDASITRRAYDRKSATYTALVAALSQGETSWRCFQCGELFTDRESASAHFGESYIRDASCVSRPDEEPAWRIENNTLRADLATARRERDAIEKEFAATLGRMSKAGGEIAALRTKAQNYDVANERYEFWMQFVRDLAAAIGWPGDKPMRDAIPYIRDCVERAWPECACTDLCIPNELHRCKRTAATLPSDTSGTK